MKDDIIHQCKKRLYLAAILTGLIWPHFVTIGHANESYTYQPWDYGFIRAPIIITTKKTPQDRELNPVYYYGNGTCVPYARIRTGIKLYGWAGTFMERATVAKYATTTEPAVGRMMITNESNGHVAVVEKVTDTHIHISEQNYKGLYIVSNRILQLDDPRILGYIY